MPDQTTSTDMERKLAAIFSTDVVGYSRLMGDDEEATIRTLTAYRVLISSLIQQYRGRVVDAPGDNLLAEFASVVDAVRCAVEIQHDLKVKNAELPEQRQMQFRIGINLGDMIYIFSSVLTPSGSSLETLTARTTDEQAVSGTEEHGSCHLGHSALTMDPGPSLAALPTDCDRGDIHRPRRVQDPGDLHLFEEVLFRPQLL